MLLQCILGNVGSSTCENSVFLGIDFNQSFINLSLTNAPTLWKGNSKSVEHPVAAGGENQHTDLKKKSFTDVQKLLIFFKLMLKTSETFSLKFQGSDLWSESTAFMSYVYQIKSSQVQYMQ